MRQPRNSATADSSRAAARSPVDALAAICMACDRRTEPTVMHCAEVGGHVMALVVRGQPFCPIGRHGKAQVDAARWIKMHRPSRLRAIGRWMMIGLAGILSYVLRLCPTPPVERFLRRETCSRCDHRRRLGLVAYCDLCRCWLRAKTAIGSQACPDRQWAAVKVFGCRGAGSLPMVGRFFKTACGGCGGAL